ncbi:MAG: hypothetical protein ACLRMZ_07665 [Blautia marasmi]
MKNQVSIICLPAGGISVAVMKEKNGYPGWKRSEAIYAVSDNLYGPYEDQGMLWPDYYEGAGHNVYPFVLSGNDPLYEEGYRYGIVLGDPWEVQGTIHLSKTLENGGEWTHFEQMDCDGSFTMTNISIFVRPTEDIRQSAEMETLPPQIL